MHYLDPLYGQLKITQKELGLFQTPALTRLRDVSLSAVPPFLWPSGMIASRFEHSVGVAFLAKKLCQQKTLRPHAKNLYLAALLHDIGSPPFSHITEPFQEALTGLNHEAFVQKMLKEKTLVQKIKSFGGQPTTVARLIQGDLPPLSDLINGSIDLDNLDNTLRWGIGAGVFNTKFYDPEEVVNAFVFDGRTLALRLEYQAHIQKWELARRLAYELVYSDLNLAPASMISRALYFAWQNNELTSDFFYLTDSQAFYLLENRFNPASRALAQDARYWRFYLPAAEITTEKPNRHLKKVCLDWQLRFQLADTLAEKLNLPPQDITIAGGKDKGFKKIHLPFVGQGQKQSHMPLMPLRWRLKIFIQPRHRSHIPRLQTLLHRLLKTPAFLT